MKILYIVPYVPTLIRVRPYNLIRFLASRGNQITLATLWSDHDELQALEGLKPHCYRLEALRLSKKRAYINMALAVPTADPLQMHYCWQPNLVKLILQLIDKEKYDVIHIEHLRGLRYALALKEYSLSSRRILPPIVWDSVDCITFLFRQAALQTPNKFKRLAIWFDLQRTSTQEAHAVSQFERVLVTSPIDKKALEELCQPSTPNNINVLPNGVDLEYFQPVAEQRDGNVVLVSGKMSYHANVAMVHYLKGEIMPLVWEQKPDIRLWIVGKDPPAEIKALARDSRILVTGAVPDIRPYLSRATLAVAPLRYGAGIQNKVLEAMASGLPVICSRQAAAALLHPEEEAFWIADGPQETSAAILKLLEQPQMREKLSKNGRHFVETYHDWNEITARLESIYRQVTAPNKNAIDD